MSRVPNHPPRPDRLEATPYGLAVVKGEPVRTEAARQFLADLDAKVSEIEARERDSK